MTDEDIIKRRLLIDGDGTGDDRRLNILLKTFLKWCNTTDNQENQIYYDRLMAQLAQCVFVTHKSERTIQMINEELSNYASLSNKIESSIEIAKEELETCKLNLMYARKVRKNREEYDAIAKVINEKPDRSKSEMKLQTLRSELITLENESEKLNNKLCERQNRFKILMQSIREIESSVNEPKMEDDSKAIEILDEDDLDIIDCQRISPALLE